MFLYTFCAAVLISSCLAAPQPERSQQKQFKPQNPVNNTQQYTKVTHTFPNMTQCIELCVLECSITNVYIEAKNIEMYTCAKLKPLKITMSGSTTVYPSIMTILVLGCIVAEAIVLFLCLFQFSESGSKQEQETQGDAQPRAQDSNDVTLVCTERESTRGGNYRTAQVV